MFGDADVLPLIKSEFLRDLYLQIRIPACKSDIARLLLLQAHGGLYVDSHVGPGNGDRLVETLIALANFEVILFEKKWERKELGDLQLMNGAMAARRNTPVLDLLIDSAFNNLDNQRKAERETPGYVPYNIFVLTGAWDISLRIFDRSIKPYKIRPRFFDIVFLHEMNEHIDPGFRLYEFYGYRKPGDHWSERQSSERLFCREFLSLSER